MYSIKTPEEEIVTLVYSRLSLLMIIYSIFDFPMQNLHSQLYISSGSFSSISTSCDLIGLLVPLYSCQGQKRININNSFSCISDRFLLLLVKPGADYVGLIRLELSEINFLITIFLFLPISTSEREHGAVPQAASNQQHELLLQGFAWVIERLTYSIFSSVWKILWKIFWNFDIWTSNYISL